MWLSVGIFLPLIIFVLLLLSGKSSKNWAGMVASLGIASSLSIFILWGIPHAKDLAGTRSVWWTWHMHSADSLVGFKGVDGGMLVDTPALLMLCLVGFISLLVHGFSLHYMQNDARKHRYFAYLGLFTTAMYCLVAASDLITLFFWWEIVGVASFLLIGFWYQKPAAAAAAKKAFIVNRIGDVLFLAGICLFIAQGIGVEFHEFQRSLESFGVGDGPLPSYGIPALLLVLGALGKSAQFPLYVWLPDAMQGPTPVSALIHAATMVVAGIYLLFRISPVLGPVLPWVGIIGGITALMGAFSALYQTDIKKILAYSTISQLGFMMIGIGSGVPETGFLHLFTHAFFKAGLFLGAGAIIHYLHQLQHAGYFPTSLDVQDLRNLGGLHKVMPGLSIAFSLCGGALAGLPLLSGFLSKEAILANALMGPAPISGWMGLGAAALTPLYITRLWKNAFLGPKPPELGTEGPPLPRLMTFIVLLLGVLSLPFWFGLDPFHADHSWLITLLDSHPTEGPSWLLWVSVALAIGGVAVVLLRKRPEESQTENEGGWLGQVSAHSFFLDSLFQRTLVPFTLHVGKGSHWLDTKAWDGMVHLLSKGQVVWAQVVGFVDVYLVDGLVNGLARLARMLGKWLRNPKSGQIQTYLIRALAASLIVLAIMILW